MSTPAALLRPTTALVAAAWIGALPSLSPDIVATRLPRATEGQPVPWLATGFVQVTPVTGRPDLYVPTRRSIVQVDCWWAARDSQTRPPAGKANDLAERVLAGTNVRAQAYSRPIFVKAGYGLAIVHAVNADTEPVEITDDPSAFARFTFDLAVDWTPA